MIEISQELIFAEIRDSKILRINFLQDFKTKQIRIVVDIWCYFFNFWLQLSHKSSSKQYIPITILVIRITIDWIILKNKYVFQKKNRAFNFADWHDLKFRFFEVTNFRGFVQKPRNPRIEIS